MTASSIRLRHVALVNPATPEFSRLRKDDEVTFLPLDAVWSGSDLDTTRTRRKSEVETGYTRFREGDILIPKITPTFEADRSAIACGLLSGVGAGTTELHVVRPLPTTDARFLWYALASRPFLLEGAASMTGVAGQRRVPDEFLRNWLTYVPTLNRQREIAGYLDTETARIDALTDCHRRLAELLGEWQQATMVGLIGDWRTVPTESLRQLGTSVLSGPFGTQLAASEYVDDGIPVVNPTHIKDGRVVPERLVSVPPLVAARLSRHRLKEGDLVMSRKGDVGRAALVTAREQGWICGSDSIAIRTSGHLDPGYLALLLTVRLYRQQLDAGSTGAMVANVNETILSSFRVPKVSAHDQLRIIRHGRAVQSRMASLGAALQRQIALLLERRQALITSAVTGQLDIPGVAA